MADIHDQQLESIEIQELIFHTIGKAQGGPEYLDEVVDHKGYEEFFVQRVKDTLKGASYSFVEGSYAASLLVGLKEKKNTFIEISKSLTKRYYELHSDDKRFTDGILIFIQIKAGDLFLFDILKVDYDLVMKFDISKKGSHRSASLGRLANALTKNKEKVQKSALLIYEADGIQICTTDRTSRIDISPQFQRFLDIRRNFQHEELTKRLFKCLLETGLKHEKELEPSIVKNLKQRIRQALEKANEVVPESIPVLAASIFGSIHENDPILVTLTKEMKKNKILNEPIKIDNSALPRNRSIKKETNEGIVITIPDLAKDRYKEVPRKDGEIDLVITTSGLKYDDISLDRTPGRH